MTQFLLLCFRSKLTAILNIAAVSFYIARCNIRPFMYSSISRDSYPVDLINYTMTCLPLFIVKSNFHHFIVSLHKHDIFSMYILSEVNSFLSSLKYSYNLYYPLWKLKIVVIYSLFHKIHMNHEQVRNSWKAAREKWEVEDLKNIVVTEIPFKHSSYSLSINRRSVQHQAETGYNRGVFHWALRR